MNEEISVDKFREYCDMAMSRKDLSKKEMAEKLKIEPAYFSKLYNGARPITSLIFQKAKDEAEGRQISAGVGAGTTNVASTTGKGTSMELILTQLIKINERLDTIENAVFGPRQKKTLPDQSQKAS